jgi:hypothetical protein
MGTVLLAAAGTGGRDWPEHAEGDGGEQNAAGHGMCPRTVRGNVARPNGNARAPETLRRLFMASVPAGCQ